MGTVFIRGDSWVGEYKDRGKIKRVSFGKKGVVTKTMAKEMLKKIEQKVKLGQYDMLDNEIPTLSEFAENYIKHVRDIVKKRSWKRDEGCLTHLKPFFGTRKLSEITPMDIDEYKQIRLTKVKPATVDRELAVLRHLFNLAKRWKKLFNENPVSVSGLLHPNNQVKRILKPEEEERLLEHCNPYLTPIVITALNTGMRKMEILSLRWANVDFETNFITVEHTNNKSKKIKGVPINSVLRTLLLGQKVKTQHTGYVFLSSQGTPYMREDSIKQTWVKTLKDAGITGLRFHDLRHTFATRAIEAGASIVAVSMILGHADLKTTMRYAHPENSLKDAVELLTQVENSNSLTDKFTDTQEIEK